MNTRPPTPLPKGFFPTLWGLLFGLLALFLQQDGAFHFFFIEQNHTLIYEGSYLADALLHPGGAARLLAQGLIQFFHLPWAGPLLLAALLTGLAWGCGRLLHHLASRTLLYVAGLLPAAAFLPVYADVNFHYSGLTAFALLLISLGCALRLGSRASWTRYTAWGLTPLLFFLAGGPAATCYVACLWALCLSRRPGGLAQALVATAWLALLLPLSLHYACVPSWTHFLLPRGFYTYTLQAGWPLYLPWGLLPLLLGSASLLGSRKVRAVWALPVQVALGLGLLIPAFQNGGGKELDFFKEPDHYLRTGAWEKMIALADRSTDKNYLLKMAQNLALAQQGHLADSLFAHPQHGPQGLYMPWNKMSHIAMLFSDLYASMGLVSLAQKLAFEANESCGNHNPRALQRLVETNLVYGAHAVAEKYLCLLEKTLFYRRWARDQRRFLYRPDLVAAHPPYRDLQAGLAPTLRFAEEEGIIADLLQIATQHPAHPRAMAYATGLCLLHKDPEGLLEILNGYAGGPALPTLPRPLAEAALMLAQEDPSGAERWGISQEDRQRFDEFNRLFDKARRQRSDRDLRRFFGDSYWYYFIFTNL